VWDWIARHGAGIQRSADWSRLLGGRYPDWQPFLDQVSDLTGVRFWAQLGGGEQEYEVIAHTDGHVAVPVEGGAAIRLNPTEAEFKRFNLDVLIAAMVSAGGVIGPPVSLDRTAHAYRLGEKAIEGRTVTIFLAPRAADVLSPRSASQFLPSSRPGSVALILVPRVDEVDRQTVSARQVAIGALPTSHPWAIDYAALADAEHLRFAIADPGEFFGRQFVLVVHKKQEKVWIEGQPLRLHAGVRPYLFLAYLADRAGTSVPHAEIVAGPLKRSIYATEGKMVNDAKNEAIRAIEKALAGVADARTTARTLIVNDKGRERLNLAPNLVRVIGS